MSTRLLAARGPSANINVCYRTDCAGRRDQTVIRVYIQRAATCNSQQSRQTSSEESASINLSPLHDRVIVNRLEEARQSAGGIMIPDTVAEKPSMGKVVAVGPGVCRKTHLRFGLDFEEPRT